MKARHGLDTPKKLLNQELGISTKSFNRAELCIAKLKSIWWFQHKGAIHSMSAAMSQWSKTHFTNRCCRMIKKTPQNDCYYVNFRQDKNHTVILIS